MIDQLVEWVRGMANEVWFVSLLNIGTMAFSLYEVFSKMKMRSTINKLSDVVEVCNDIKEKLDEAKVLDVNTNKMISANIDMCFAAFANSKSTASTKVLINSIYSACPDATTDKMENGLTEPLSAPVVIPVPNDIPVEDPTVEPVEAPMSYVELMKQQINEE